MKARHLLQDRVTVFGRIRPVNFLTIPLRGLQTLTKGSVGMIL